MSQKINVGLVGYGMAGEFFHAPLIHATEGFVLHSVVERNQSRSKERYPNVQIVRDYKELLADKDIDLIVLATPNDTHFEYAQMALMAGKHVVIDKPFVTKTADGETLIRLAKEKNLVLSVYQNRRLDGDFLTVKKLIEQKAVGDLNEYRGHYDRFRPELRLNSWKEDAGIFVDLGPHLIDQALHLFGKPLSVSTKTEVQRTNAKAVDYFEVSLNYPNFKAFLSAGMLYETPRPRFELVGTEGTFAKFGLDPQENCLKAGQIPCGKDWGKEPEENWGTLKTSTKTEKIPTENGNYPAYYANIYSSILGKSEVLVKPEEALEAIRIIENN